MVALALASSPYERYARGLNPVSKSFSSRNCVPILKVIGLEEMNPYELMQRTVRSVPSDALWGRGSLTSISNSHEGE
jgi:hypothetical protein